ncbi:MAG: response regulator [Nitrospirae bacterium]|nr:MAG: response regulator [Nitrospirota bacterium]
MSEKILCVDDEPQNLKLLEAMLVPRGYVVVLSDNGADALTMIREHKIDLVLLDVMMPKINGFDVCKLIKENERYRNIPIIMVTGLTAKEDRIKAIESGAEDFISKPFDKAEIVARIEMLLKMKNLNDRLLHAYSNINSLIYYGEEMVKTFDPLNFDFESRIDSVVDQIIRHGEAEGDKPTLIVIGISDKDLKRKWFLYRFTGKLTRREILNLDVHPCMVISGDEPRIAFFNNIDIETSDIQPIIKMVEATNVKASNVVSYHSKEICIHAFNYNREVTSYDASVLNSIVMQSLFLKSLSGQVKDTDDAFAYTVHALARAAEVNDEDTGNHILRVGEYCALLAKHLGMSEKFISIIRIQSQMHDVGKIHIPPEILKKPGRLITEEFDIVKKHPEYGVKIIGDHVRLTMAKTIALTHHERWDGGGYPFGLKGEQIPVDGRILNLVDIYDALRNKRVYKPAIDHETTYKIITEGDGRTMPNHFDPAVLDAFKGVHKQFDEIYERMKG